MQKIILVPNLHLPNSQFLEWGQSLGQAGPEVLIFDKSLEEMMKMSWKELLEEFQALNKGHFEKNKELYYITEGWGMVPVLEAVESHKISGVFSLQPIISQAKKYKRKWLFEKTPKPAHLLERTEAAIHLFLPEQSLENDHKKTIKHLKNFAKPNISINTFETPTLFQDLYLDEVKIYILRILGLMKR